MRRGRTHLQSGGGDAVGIGEAADAAADGERHEDVLARLLDQRQHRRVVERKVAEAGDVEEGELVGALLVILARERDGLAEVADLAAARAALVLLAHVVLVALRAH